jgi:hypothetical protein
MRSFLWKTFLVIILLGAIVVYWFFFNVYSSGERKGTLIKITRKGNVFKTYEGEMWLSCRQMMNAEKFFFSISEPKLADSLMNLQDECLQLIYEQYRRPLPWRGDSKYMVVGFESVVK